MGIVAKSDETALSVSSDSPIWRYVLLALYAILVAAIAARHEPWADEAQSWLLARDATLIELWTKVLRYEGTPGLWQTLLHILIRIGLPYSGLNFVSAAAGATSVWLLIRFSPFPLPAKLTLPFGYFLAYQYSVVARSYCLLPLLLFLTAALLASAPRAKSPLKIWSLVTVLILMAGASVYGFVISLAIGISLVITCWRSRPWMASSVYLITIALIALSARPAPDGTFVTRLNFSVEHLILTVEKTFAQAFTGESLTSIGLVALSLPFFMRGGSLLVFLLSTGLLCTVNAVIYAQVWHLGLLFLVWIFCFWIAASKTEVTKLATIPLAIITAIHCYCTVQTIRYDWLQPYSGSLAAAHYLRDNRIPASGTIYGVGYACVALQPYFRQNIFRNWNDGKSPAFWDWSRGNRSLTELSMLSTLNPDFVVVGYTGLAEKVLWSHDVRRSGYERIEHFEGNLFWRSEVLEPASFDVYRRRP
jgi:hypothetical protein